MNRPFFTHSTFYIFLHPVHNCENYIQYCKDNHFLEEVVMKRRSRLLIAALAAAVLLLTAGVGAFAHGWDIEESEKVEALSGKISFAMPGGFTLTTTSGQKYKLMMHPIRFLNETGLELNASDRVNVSGYQVEDTVILVTELQKGLKSYTLMSPEEFEKIADHYGKRGRRPGRGYGAPMCHHGPYMGAPGWDDEGPGGMRGYDSRGQDWD